MGPDLGAARQRASMIVAILHVIALSAAAIGIVMVDAWLRRPP